MHCPDEGELLNSNLLKYIPKSEMENRLFYGT